MGFGPGGPIGFRNCRASGGGLGSGGRAWHRSAACGSRAGLAQLVEQRFCKPKVTGSNPVAGTIRVETAT